MFRKTGNFVKRELNSPPVQKKMEPFDNHIDPARPWDDFKPKRL